MRFDGIPKSVRNLKENWRKTLNSFQPQNPTRHPSLDKLRALLDKSQARLGDSLNYWLAQSRLMTISTWLNQITGYEVCEKLRLEVQKSDENFTRIKNELRKSKAAFDNAVTSRSSCQKELNMLLQRKQNWSDEDLQRFTELYRQEMRLEQNEAETKATNDMYEKLVDTAHQNLMDKIRERYQEEQLWSDKIRRISTYGTFSLMFINVFLFIIIQLYVEPRKRRKLLAEFHQIIGLEINEAKQSMINNNHSTVPRHVKAEESDVENLTASSYTNDFKLSTRLSFVVGALSSLFFTVVVQKLMASSS